jgi:hypothetical protein
MGTPMSEQFETELDAIVGAYKAVIDQAKQQALDARTAAATFSKGWEASRNSIVLPTLTKIVATLAKKSVGASIVPLPAGNGIALHVPYPGRTDVRGHTHPQITISANPNTSRVEIKHLHAGSGVGSADDDNYTVAEITPELIEKHVLALVRDVYR